jgi:hypothetical protein
MSNVGNTDDSNKSIGLSFGMYRRRVVEQVMGRRDLSSMAKIESYSIAGMSNHKTWSTLSSSLTTGRRGNLKPDEAAKGRKELLKTGQLRIKKRENGTAEISLVLRKDIEKPEVPTYVEGAFFKTPAYRQFLADRSAFLDRVIAAKDLSHSDKVIAFGAGRFIDPNTWTINASYRAIGEAVGYSMETAKLSIGRLFARGYFKKRNIDGRAPVLIPTMSVSAAVAPRGRAHSRWDLGKNPGKDPGRHPGNANLRSDHLAGVSAPNSGDHGCTGDFPSGRRPRQGAGRFQDAKQPVPTERRAMTRVNDLSFLAEDASTSSLAAEAPPAPSSHVVQAASAARRDELVQEALKQLGCSGVENADCFWLVRHHYGESKVGLVKIALEAYGPDETWERAIEAIETGEDIGRALWVPDT